MGVLSSIIVQVIIGANEATIQTLFVMACCCVIRLAGLLTEAAT